MFGSCITQGLVCNSRAILLNHWFPKVSIFLGTHSCKNTHTARAAVSARVSTEIFRPLKLYRRMYFSSGDSTKGIHTQLPFPFSFSGLCDRVSCPPMSIQAPRPSFLCFFRFERVSTISYLIFFDFMPFGNPPLMESDLRKGHDFLGSGGALLLGHVHLLGFPIRHRPPTTSIIIEFPPPEIMHPLSHKTGPSLGNKTGPLQRRYIIR